MGLLLATLFTAGLVAWQPTRWITIGAAMTAPVAVVIAVRIAQDLARDPTSHNLLPFEFVLGLPVGVVAAGVGIAVGRWVRQRIHVGGVRTRE